MEDFLTMDNILTEDEAATLFDSTVTDSPVQKEDVKDQNKQTNNTAEIKEENPFDVVETTEDDPTKSESVGSEEEGKGQEDTESNEDDGTPSNSNFYSSIASALKEEGIFPDLDDDVIDKIQEPEDFRNLVQQQVEASLNETQKRIYDALNDNVEPNIIRQYENTLGYLNNITEDNLNDESEQGENLRRRLLQQDFMNRGYSQERAVKMTEKLFATGEDIEEAKQALLGNKEYFGKKYQEILDNAKAEQEQKRRDIELRAEQLKKDILSKDKIFGDIPIDKATRQKIYDNISKPIYKNKETGEYYTALQKYRLENENEYLKNFSLFYTLTDGFTNIDKLVQPTAKKEVKKKLRELEHTINNTARANSGVLKYVGSSDGTKSSKSFLDQGFVLDIK